VERFEFSDAHFLVQNFAKVYPNKITIFEYPYGFYKLKEGFEPSQPKPHTNLGKHKDQVLSRLNSSERSLRRTKTLISDLVLSNSFDMFATFTFKDHRDNMDMCRSRMINWLKSQQKQHGRFQYVIVPEFHKDGKSLHFHALLGGYKGQLVDSGKKVNGRKAFNIKSYRTGFSTVIKIDNVEKVSSYVKKYITKDMPMITSKKRFWCSTELARPKIAYNIDLSEYEITPVVENDYFTISSAVLKS